MSRVHVEVKVVETNGGIEQARRPSQREKTWSAALAMVGASIATCTRSHPTCLGNKETMRRGSKDN